MIHSIEYTNKLERVDRDQKKPTDLDKRDDTLRFAKTFLFASFCHITNSHVGKVSKPHLRLPNDRFIIILPLEYCFQLLSGLDLLFWLLSVASQCEVHIKVYVVG